MEAMILHRNLQKKNKIQQKHATIVDVYEKHIVKDGRISCSKCEITRSGFQLLKVPKMEIKKTRKIITIEAHYTLTCFRHPTIETICLNNQSHSKGVMQ